MVNQNRPDTPIQPVRTGASNRAAKNAPPMDMPMIAMALVRCRSRVRSAVSANTTAAMAPAPCNARPAMIQAMCSARAATTLPAAKTNNPIVIMVLRPIRSDNNPYGICSSAWVRP